MNKSIKKQQKRTARRRRIRARIFGTALRPRLSVHKSNTQLRAQLINDENGTTLVAVATSKIDGSTKKEKLQSAAQKLAEEAKSKKIKKVVFDRGGFEYTGNIKLFADSVREAGLEF